MSCHHVLAQPTERKGIPISTRDPDAEHPTDIHSANLQAWTNNETFDYAIAKYRVDTDCENAYRACQDGSTHGYVDEFADKINVNGMHFKVGFTTGCTTGKLLGVGNVTLDGETLKRRGQLVFERMAAPGDSGSIVVHQDTNRIVGLHFAGGGDPNRSYSCPIYKVGFRLMGSFQFLSGARVPVYDASDAVVPISPEESERLDIGHKETGCVARSDNRIAAPFDPSSPNSQSLIGGKLFLGAWTVNVKQSGIVYPNPEPLPVTGGEVTRVVLDYESGYHDTGERPGSRHWHDGRAIVLYFG